MFYQNIPLYLKLIQLLRSEYTIVHNLSKEYKYSLGQDIITRSWELVDLFMSAQFMNAATERGRKNNIIIELDLRFEELKLRIRFLSELKLISLGQTAALNDSMVEIGKMIGSWRKNA